MDDENPDSVQQKQDDEFSTTLDGITVPKGCAALIATGDRLGLVLPKADEQDMDSDLDNSQHLISAVYLRATEDEEWLQNLLEWFDDSYHLFTPSENCH